MSTLVKISMVSEILSVENNKLGLLLTLISISSMHQLLTQGFVKKIIPHHS